MKTQIEILPCQLSTQRCQFAESSKASKAVSVSLTYSKSMQVSNKPEHNESSSKVKKINRRMVQYFRQLVKNKISLQGRTLVIFDGGGGVDYVFITIRLKNPVPLIGYEIR